MSLNRYRAGALHLGISVLVGLCVSAIVFWVWYPGVLADACGVTVIFLMMLGIDVVLGPCITLIVFNPAKKSLRFDMFVVAFVQVSALLYGMHSVFVARPVYVVFNVDRFDLVLANALEEKKLAHASDPVFRSLPWGRPVVVAAKLPSSSKARNELLFQSLAGGADLPELPEYYVSYASCKEEILARLQPLSVLRKTNQGRLAEITTLERRYIDRKASVGFLPVRGKVQALTAIVARDSAEVLEFVDLSPW